MADRDWYPRSREALAIWWANFTLRRPDFEAKYPILGTLKNELNAAGAWMDYWASAMHIFSDLGQQMSKYFNTIAGNDKSADPPQPIKWTIPPGMPAEVPPGIEKIIRDVRRDVVGQIDYAVADGEALGFETVGAKALNPDVLTAAFEVKTLVGFELQMTFRKYGMDAMRFEFRYKGGDWQSAGTLINSAGVLHILPQTPGQAEQIELRAVYLKGNDTFGNYSDTKTALIAP